MNDQPNDYPEGVTARVTAIRILEQVRDGRTLEAALAAELATGSISPRDTAFIRELVNGSCRWWLQLRWVLGELLNHDLPAAQRVVETALLCGLYQLRETRVPVHAAISTTVDCVSQLGGNKMSGLANAVLRRYDREADSINERLAAQYAGRLAYPKWWLRELDKDWDDASESIANGGNARPPMTLRVNRLQTSAADYLKQLNEADLTATTITPSETAVRMENPIAVEQLPGWQTGAVAIQDQSAQYAASLLDLQPGQRVLDACAAPGGKTCQILEAEPQLGSVLAVDSDEMRQQRTHDNLERLKLEAAVVIGDAGEPAGWWDGKPFDRILLDAPCTGSGVVRRHPDIKLLRRKGDIAQFVASQRRLLEAVWPLLASGGKLVYATCSVFRDENDRQVEAFTAAHRDAEIVSIDLNDAKLHGINTATGWQLLPSTDNDGWSGDGFFWSVIRKSA